MKDDPRLTRRELIAAAAATGITLAVPAGVAAATPAFNSQQSPSSPKWFNEPKQWKREGESLICTADPKTDFWRKTDFPYITDNGHFYHRTVTGNFTTVVKVTGKYRDLYDQAGLMIRMDESNWMKCGVEMVEGTPHMSVVVTHDFSDWSTFDLGKYDAPLWLRLIRKNEALKISHSLNGKDFVEDRIAFFMPTPNVELGVMLAAPDGKGFEVRFDDWTVQPEALKA